MRWLQHVIGRPEQAHGVQSPEAYRLHAKEFLLRLGLSPVLITSNERPVAYVSDGRWVCDCPCGNGCSASPEWELAICLECGIEYVPTFPAKRKQAEAVLLARPHPKFRHFFPAMDIARRKGLARGETVADLLAENTRMLPGEES